MPNICHIQMTPYPLACGELIAMSVCVGAVRESVGTHEVVCSDVTCQVKSEEVGGFAKQMSSVSRVSELCMDG